jgi:sialate O-acetylesterase
MQQKNRKSMSGKSVIPVSARLIDLLYEYLLEKQIDGGHRKDTFSDLELRISKAETPRQLSRQGKTFRANCFTLWYHLFPYHCLCSLQIAARSSLMRREYSFFGLAATLLVVCCLPTQADVKLPALFSNGMVLQSGDSTPIWGTADPGEQVSVTIDFKNGKEPISKKVQANSQGHWELILAEESNPGSRRRGRRREQTRAVGLTPGGPYSLMVSGKNQIAFNEVYVGEVWICSGQSNMEWPAHLTTGANETIQNSKSPQLRLFTVAKAISDQPLHEVKGTWQECNPDTVKNFSAVAYFFGRDLQKALKVPVGLIHTSWGGTRAEAWTRHEILDSHEEWKGEFHAYERAKTEYPKALEKFKADQAKAKSEGKSSTPNARQPFDPSKNPNSPSVLYNAMIAPLIPYGIKGAIWYQGESNAGGAYLYRKLFPVMIQNWRDDWKRGDFPFLFVQLAPWQAIAKEPQESAWAELRESQLLTSQNLPHTGMAVITDVGDPKDIHPRDKEPVGARLALAARALAYREPVEYSGPIYNSMEVGNSTAILSFKHVGKGLEARGGSLTGFTIAGEDHRFHNAQAEIMGEKVYVSCPEVPHPIAVRYGWANCPVVNLWNKDGLPASPFRTDDFQMVTKPKESPKAK